MFTEAWNNHPLSSSRNLSPQQLWITGLSRQHLQQDADMQLTEVTLVTVTVSFKIPYNCHNQLLQEEAQLYGIDWDGPIADYEDEAVTSDTVHVIYNLQCVTLL